MPSTGTLTTLRLIKRKLAEEPKAITKSDLWRLILLDPDYALREKKHVRAALGSQQKLFFDFYLCGAVSDDPQVARERVELLEKAASARGEDDEDMNLSDIYTDCLFSLTMTTRSSLDPYMSRIARATSLRADNDPTEASKALESLKRRRAYLSSLAREGRSATTTLAGALLALGPPGTGDQTKPLSIDGEIFVFDQKQRRWLPVSGPTEHGVIYRILDSRQYEEEGFCFIFASSQPPEPHYFSMGPGGKRTPQYDVPFYLFRFVKKGGLLVPQGVWTDGLAITTRYSWPR